jgi:cbb3-type cytochrome oxidase cytochrome c subunit
LAVIHSDAPPVHRPWRRNLGFGAGSLLLLLGTVWLVYFDYHREWKRYQRQFRALEVSKAEEKLQAEETRLSTDQPLADLDRQLEAAKAELAQHSGDLEAARKTLDAAGKHYYIAEQRWKIDKSNYDAQKYEFEEERRRLSETIADASARDAAVGRAQEKFAQFEKGYQDAVAGLEAATTERDGAQAQVKSLTGKVDDLNKKIGRLTDSESALLRKIDTNKPTLTTAIRNAPVIDMAAPTLKIDQVILPNLLSDINFTLIPKVDRCVTCHKGIMDASYKDDAEPFTAHPKLDLFLSDNSPHPYNKIGCTVCHLGLDRATSFESAMHTPRDEEQGERWHHDHGWHAPHYWDFPQLPLEHAQASCRTCHLREVRLKGADRYNHSLDIVEKAGCFGCHKIAGYEEQRKTGPDLRHVAAKVRPEWAYRWIEDPRSYRPTTWMPRFFNLSNTSTPEDKERSKVEIAAIVGYLFDKSAPFLPSAARAPAGDAARGRQVVSDRGCLGCHRIGESPTQRGTFGRDFGPALDRVGDKVTAEWLYEWVRNPKSYFPETNMPNLRLTDQEAADVTAYLMSLRKGPPEPPPSLDEKLLDDVALEYLKAKLTSDQARQKLASMSLQEKKEFLGEKLIARYGCFGCHNIAGFEQALPIGVELSTEGTKMITRLDFGFAEIPHTKPAWFLQKMKDPRIFDHGKVKAPQEKLKMPDFGFTDDEAGTAVTFILSMQKDVQPMGSKRVLDERAAAVEQGRRIIQNKNCRGCHIIEGEGGAIREVITDQAYYPPNLFGEGEKVQSEWLFGFLEGPSPIRPWLKVHMPTFQFTDADATAIAKYFASADKAPFPFQSASAAPVDPDLIRQGKQTFEQFKCISCHTVGAPPPGVSVADLAPDLTMAGGRLRHDWITKWLRDPQKLMPGTRMPGFFYSDEQPLYPDADRRMQAVKEYLLTLGEGPHETRRMARAGLDR